MKIASIHVLQRALALLLPLLLLSSAPGTPARAPRARSDIQFELQGLVYVQASINNSRPMWLVLDTGAGGLTLDSTAAADIGIRTRGNATSAGAAGFARSQRATGVQLSIGNAVVPDIVATVTNLTELESTAGRRINGIIGFALFSRYVVDIDYDSQLIRLIEPADFGYTGTGSLIPLSLEREHIYANATVAFANGAPLTGRFLIDSGAGTPLLFNTPFARKNNLLARLSRTTGTIGAGVGGKVSTTLGRIDSLTFGANVLRAPVASFSDASVGAIAATNAAGLIGNSVLRRFHVIIDYSRRTLILERGRHFDDPFVADMSGLGLVSKSPGFQTDSVAHVIPNTPAAEAGVRAGDVLLQINGQRAPALSLFEIREMLKEEGATVALTLRRHAEIVHTSFKLRPLV